MTVAVRSRREADVAMLATLQKRRLCVPYDDNGVLCRRGPTRGGTRDRAIAQETRENIQVRGRLLLGITDKVRQRTCTHEPS